MDYKREYQQSSDKIKDVLFYEMGSSVLKNKLGIIDQNKMDEEETIGFGEIQGRSLYKICRSAKSGRKTELYGND